MLLSSITLNNIRLCKVYALLFWILILRFPGVVRFIVHVLSMEAAVDSPDTKLASREVPSQMKIILHV